MNIQGSVRFLTSLRVKIRRRSETYRQSLIAVGAIVLTFVIIALANRAYMKLCVVRKTS